MKLPHLDPSGIRVLIVDDNANMRRIVAGLGVKSIYEAEDRADVLDAISRNDPDLIILDWLMPLVNGSELTRRIRASHAPACFVPIIAVTANPGFSGDERRGQPVDDGYTLDGPSELPQSHSPRAGRESATG